MSTATAQKVELGPIKEIPLDRLKPHPKNDTLFRVESEHYFQGLMENMKKRGQSVPIIVDQDNKILCGHNRVKVAKFLKWKTIKATKVLKNFKSEQDEVAFMVGEQLDRRHFGPADRVRVYEAAFPNLVDRVMVETRGRPNKSQVRDEDRFGLSAKQISEKTGISLRTVSQDIHKLRKNITDLRGLKKAPIRMGSVENKTALSAVRRNCTGIMSAVLEENRKTQESAAALVQETLNQIKAGLKKKRS